MGFLTQLFSPSFFLSLGVIVLATALLVLYYENKLREQNHKITTMFSLVSTMAEDLAGMKMGMHNLAMERQHPGSAGPIIFDFQPNFTNSNKVIEVSDDEDEIDYEVNEVEDDDEVDDDDDEVDDDDDDDDEDEVDEVDDEDEVDEVDEDDEDEDEDEEDEDDDEQDDEEIDKYQESIVDLEELNEEVDHDIMVGNTENNAFVITEFDSSDLNDVTQLEDEQLISLEQEDALNTNLAEELTENILKGQMEEIKVLKISHEDEDNHFDEENEKQHLLDAVKTVSMIVEEQSPYQTDFKKFQLSKLRQLAVEKGIITSSEASKLKKPDLLKLLEEQ